MSKLYTSTFFLFLFFSGVLCAQNKDSLSLRKHFDYYLTKSYCYKNLEFLTTKIESRLSGSPGAAKAVAWAKKAMYEAGADTVYLQPCMVPHWVRGEKESCSSVNPKTKQKTAYAVCALGNSIATPKTGLSAPVIVVNSYAQLDSLGEKNIKGKIVFYNVYFDHRHLSTGSCYGETVTYRYAGPSRAAKYGAVATLVRSMSSINNDFPHTGVMRYDTTVSQTKIPCCAISFHSADVLLQQLKQEPALKLSLKMSCTTLADEPSFNVVGEIKGSEKPNEIIMAGGHLDAWDNGQGAHDDGSGIVQAIEVLAMFKKQNIKPKHTIRAVAFMNEENGGRGGKAYFEDTKKNNLKHIAALESDAGGFSPRGIAVDTTLGAYKTLLSWKPLLDPYFLQYIHKEGHGADIEYLQDIGVPLIGFEPDGQKYFDYHHTADDTFDKVNKRELELAAGVIGSIVYLIDTKGW
jgi:carboxypeptidase Q